MVYYNQGAYEDLNHIFYSLIMWVKHPLTPEHASQYVADIEEVCKTLDRKVYHKQYGDYVHNYKRNRNTCWYIIYNKDLFDNIVIERIMNNYLTIS